MTPTPITDRLAHVIGGEAHATTPADDKRAGGEWDAWYALPRRTRKRLTGAGYARRGAMQPDVFADLLRSRGFGDDYRQALERFYGEALLAIIETRRARTNNSRARQAKATGHRSYFALRNARAVALGYRSFWHLRATIAKGEHQPTTEMRTAT